MFYKMYVLEKGGRVYRGKQPQLNFNKTIGFSSLEKGYVRIFPGNPAPTGRAPFGAHQRDIIWETVPKIAQQNPYMGMPRSPQPPPPPQEKDDTTILAAFPRAVWEQGYYLLYISTYLLSYHSCLFTPFVRDRLYLRLIYHYHVAVFRCTLRKDAGVPWFFIAITRLVCQYSPTCCQPSPA